MKPCRCAGCVIAMTLSFALNEVTAAPGPCYVVAGASNTPACVDCTPTACFACGFGVCVPSMIQSCNMMADLREAEEGSPGYTESEVFFTYCHEYWSCMPEVGCSGCRRGFFIGISDEDTGVNFHLTGDPCEG